MSHQRWHTWEKVQVEIGMVIGLVVMYLLAGSVLRTWDPDQAVIFLPKMEWARLAVFVAVVWGLAALCALLTTSARPEGALLATLVGTGGVSLRSESLTGLLRTHATDLPRLLVPLAAELALMAPVIIVAWLIIRLVRRVVVHIQPGWVRPDDIHISGPVGLARSVRAKGQAGSGSPGQRADRLPLADRLITFGAAFGLTLLVGLFLVIVLMYTAERGQILFALAASFFIASVASSYFFPAGTSAACWPAPIVLGVIFYLKACWVPSSYEAWTQLSEWAHALPVDWLSAGCGGAVGGYWLACRLRDVAQMPKPADAVLEE